MMRCSPEAFAKCPTRALCGNIQEATFTEGSECDLFNQSVLDHPMTDADKIRTLSDESLVGFVKKLVRMGDISGLYCKSRTECSAAAASDANIPEEWCDACLLEWLRTNVGEQL